MTPSGIHWHSLRLHWHPLIKTGKEAEYYSFAFLNQSKQRKNLSHLPHSFYLIHLSRLSTSYLVHLSRPSISFIYFIYLPHSSVSFICLTKIHSSQHHSPASVKLIYSIKKDRLKSLLVLWFASDQGIMLMLINSSAKSHSFSPLFSSLSLLNGALLMGFAEADEWGRWTRQMNETDEWDRWMRQVDETGEWHRRVILRQVGDDKAGEVSINFVWALRTGGVYFFQKVDYMIS